MNKQLQTGSVPIYITLLMIAIITSGAIAMSGILSKQLRFSEDATTSERAFYAANSGVEEALNALEQKRENNDFTALETIRGEVEYDGDEKASYVVEGTLAATSFRTVFCVESEGEFRGEKRKVQFGPSIEECTAE